MVGTTGSASFEHEIELFEYRGGARSDRILWTVYELGLEDKLTSRPVEYSPDDPNFQKLCALNVMQQVPTMVLTAPDGSSITATESCAAAALLAEACGKLQPPVTNLFARSQYLRLMSFAASELDNAVVTVFVNINFATEKDPKREAEARKTFDNKVSKVLEGMLENNGNPVQWLCEPYHEGFTAADIVVSWILWIGKKVGMLEGKPILEAYLDRCMQREAWIKMHPNA